MWLEVVLGLEVALGLAVVLVLEVVLGLEVVFSVEGHGCTLHAMDLLKYWRKNPSTAAPDKAVARPTVKSAGVGM